MISDLGESITIAVDNPSIEVPKLDNGQPLIKSILKKPNKNTTTPRNTATQLESDEKSNDTMLKSACKRVQFTQTAQKKIELEDEEKKKKANIFIRTPPIFIRIFQSLFPLSSTFLYFCTASKKYVECTQIPVYEKPQQSEYRQTPSRVSHTKKILYLPSAWCSNDDTVWHALNGFEESKPSTESVTRKQAKVHRRPMFAKERTVLHCTQWFNPSDPTHWKQLPDTVYPNHHNSQSTTPFKSRGAKMLECAMSEQKSLPGSPTVSLQIKFIV
ncbi:hypothetical protein RFI_17942, partial [Reticulomyxa filosa]